MVQITLLWVRIAALPFLATVYDSIIVNSLT